MPRHFEPLSGGLATAKDPVALAVGELVLMQNAVYVPGNEDPTRATGRAIFGSATGDHTPVRGLRDAKFDNGDHFLLALVGGNVLRRAPVGDTGTFSTVTTFHASGTALEAVHYNNEWYLFGAYASAVASASGDNAYISNFVMYTSATAAGTDPSIRLHGMVPNRTEVQSATGAGTWTAGATGYFEYWFTELFEYVHDGVTSVLESTFYPAGIPHTVFISSTAMQASIYVPGAPTHPGAQKWRLYRSGPKALATDKLYPEGFKLFDGTFGSVPVLDGSATTGSYFSVTATANSGFAALTNPTNVLVSDTSYATHTGATPGGVAGTFATITVTEPVVGITVEVEGFRSGGGFLSYCHVQISNDSGVTWSAAKNATLPAADGVVEVGGPADLWGLNWTNANLVAGVLRVRLVISSTATVSIDHFRIKITSAGSPAQDESVPFPAIVISAGEVEVAVGSHGQPPPATTADIFQGSLVTNSRRVATNGATEKSFIRWSLPDAPDYFADPYYLDFQTNENDEVTNLKTLNNRLGVFLNTGLWRVNYLPSEADSNFNRGICRNQVSDEVGCVNAMCAARYSGPGGYTEIAFVSDGGIFTTNLFQVRDAIPGVNYRALVATANSSPIALVNNPEARELLFYFSNTALGVEHYQCLHLSYDDDHMKGGRLKASGPVHMRNLSGASTFADLYSAWVVRRSGGVYNTFLGYGGGAASATAAGAGQVYREQGADIPSSDDKMKLKSRRMYLNGLGEEVRLDKGYVYIPTAATGQILTFTPYNTLTNDETDYTNTAESYLYTGGHLFSLPLPQASEGLQIEIAQASADGGTLSVHGFSLYYTSYGIEDSGS